MSRDKNKLDLSKRHFDTKGAFINNAPIIDNISNNIKANITTTVYTDLMKADPKQQHNVHSAKGTKTADSGAYVFEFRTAGSSNNQWNKIYKGINGHNEDVKLTPLEVKELQQEKSYFDEIANTMKQKYHLDFNNDITEEELAAKLEKEYGTPLYMDDHGIFRPNAARNTKMLSGVRIKKDSKTNKVIANLSGPLGTLMGTKMGIFNSGDYSIDNLKSYMLQLADTWLSQVKAKKEATKDTNPVYFFMQGHSRGGVATAEASAMIQNLINTKYKELKDQIHIDVRLYDPVPGTDAHSNHHTIDHKKDSFQVHGKNNASGLMSKDAKDQNDLTVLYSIHSNHDTNFKPMNVLGAKRVILSPRDHDMGIYDVGGSGNNLHKKGYINGEDGDEYRGTGIHDLKEGLFVLDENNILIEIKNQQEAHMLLDSIYADKSDYWQRSRHNTMYGVVDEWFSRHKEEITPKDTRYAPLKAIKEDVEALKQYLANDGSIKDPEGMKSRVMASLLTHVNILNKAQNDPLRFTQGAFDKYKRMSGDFTHIIEFEKDAAFKGFINSLTDEQIKEIVEHPSPAEIVEKYRAVLPSVLPETGRDIVERNLGQAVVALNNVLNSEVTDNPDLKIPDVENAKRHIVANIVANRVVNKMAKKDLAGNETSSKDKYSKLINNVDAEVKKIIQDSDFIRFYEKLEPNDIQSLASGSIEAADKMLEGYIASRDLSEKEKTFEDIGLISKLNDDIFTNKAFFKDKMDEEGHVKPEHMTEELKASTRTSHITIRICAMLKDGYKLEDILDPYKLSEVKKKYGDKEFPIASNLASTALLCKQKLTGKEPFEIGDTSESLTQAYIRAEEEKIQQTELYKIGLQKALEYVDKKVLGMKSLNLSEIAKPENRQLYVLTHFLQDIGQEIYDTAAQYPNEKRGTSFVDNELESLISRQVGFNSLMGPISDKAIAMNKKIVNSERISFEEVMPQIIAQKSNENLANDALKQVKKGGESFTSFVKEGSKTFDKISEMINYQKINEEELATFCSKNGNPELAKQTLIKEAMTNSSSFRNVNRSCDKDTLKQITNELAKVQKQLPQKEATNVRY